MGKTTRNHPRQRVPMPRGSLHPRRQLKRRSRVCLAKLASWSLPCPWHSSTDLFVQAFLCLSSSRVSTEPLVFLSVALFSALRGSTFSVIMACFFDPRQYLIVRRIYLHTSAAWSSTNSLAAQRHYTFVGVFH